MDYCRAFLLFSGFALPVFFFGRGGGGGVDNVQAAYIVRYRLRIPQYLQALARLSLKVVVFDGTECLLRPSTQQ